MQRSAGNRLIFLLILGFVILRPVPGFAGVPIPIAEDNVNPNSAPDINANGEIIYLLGGGASGGGDVMLYDGQGGDPEPLTNGEGLYWSPKINDEGQAVWFGWSTDFEIGSSTPRVFSYNGSVVQDFEANGGVPFTNGSTTPPVSSTTSFNNARQVVWDSPKGEDGPLPVYDEITLMELDGNTTADLTNTALESFSPSISDAGHVAYVSENTADGTSTDIYLYHEGATQQVTDDIFLDIKPKVNSNGELAWLTISGPEPGVNFFDGIDIMHLGDYTSDDLALGPQNLFMDLNNGGHVVWNSHGDIFLFDGTDSLHLTNTPDILETRPSINAAGDVVWESTDLAQTDSHIELFDSSGNTPITQLDTDDTVFDRNPKLADNGDVVWVAGPNPASPTIIAYDADAIAPPPPPPPPPDDGGGDTEPTTEVSAPKVQLLINPQQPIQSSEEVHGLVNLFPENPFDQSNPTIVITHGRTGATEEQKIKYNPDKPDTGLFPLMTAALKERFGEEGLSNYNVVAWKWKEQARGVDLKPEDTAVGPAFAFIKIAILEVAKLEGDALKKELINNALQKRFI